MPWVIYCLLNPAWIFPKTEPLLPVWEPTYKMYNNVNIFFRDTDAILSTFYSIKKSSNDLTCTFFSVSVLRYNFNIQLL